MNAENTDFMFELEMHTADVQNGVKYLCVATFDGRRVDKLGRG